MITCTCPVWEETEYENPLKGKFIPNIVSYIHDEDREQRPALLIVPGGGYRMVAYSEGEIVAKKFYAKGYNVFVLSYTIIMFEKIALHLQPLKDLARAISFIRGHKEEFCIDPKQVVVCGFSAGGHLTASLAVHFDDVQIRASAYQNIEIRPDAVILSYPVITSGEFAHRDSFLALLGETPTEEELAYMSLEKHVKKETPPVFVWNTATDEEVPMENGYLFISACRKQGVPYEFHVFQDGPHGYSVADEEWAEGEYGGDYTMNQWFAHVQYYIDSGLELPVPFQELKLSPGTDYREIFRNSPKEYLKNKANQSVAMWPDLAEQWMRRILKNKE